MGSRRPRRASPALRRGARRGRSSALAAASTGPAGRRSCRRREDLAAYDGAFHQFWEGGPPPVGRQTVATPVVVELPSSDPDLPHGDDAPDQPDRTEVVRYSAVETLHQKDFAAYTAEDFEAARRLMAVLRLRPPPGRRADCAPRPPAASPTCDAPSGGRCAPVAKRCRWPGAPPDPGRAAWSCCATSAGSMEPYSRALLRFAHAAVVGTVAGRGLRAGDAPVPPDAAIVVA